MMGRLRDYKRDIEQINRDLVSYICNMREGVYLAIRYRVISICADEFMHDFTYVHFYRPQRSWGKVIFPQASVILLTEEGGCLVPGGACSWVWVWSRGVPGGDLPTTATAAGGTHPTGMHSCMQSVSLYYQVGLGNGGGARQHVSFDQNDDFDVSYI